MAGCGCHVAHGPVPLVPVLWVCHHRSEEVVPIANAWREVIEVQETSTDLVVPEAAAPAFLPFSQVLRSRSLFDNFLLLTVFWHLLNP